MTAPSSTSAPSLFTDEFFALVSPFDQSTFNRWYALGVGLCMYVGWNIFTLLGVVLIIVAIVVSSRMASGPAPGKTALDAAAH